MSAKASQASDSKDCNSPRVIELFLDETYHKDPALTAVGSLVLEADADLVEESLKELYEEITENAFYLESTRTLSSLKKKGFHAADDGPDVSGRMIFLLSQLPGAKILIEYSDHSARPDLTQKQVVGLLTTRLCETILRKYAWADEVRFTFEQGGFMQSECERIAQIAARRAGYGRQTRVRLAKKKEPHTLSIIDYALVALGRVLKGDAPDWQHQNWRAIRPLVSVVHCLDTGRIYNRANLEEI